MSESETDLVWLEAAPEHARLRFRLNAQIPRADTAARASAAPTQTGAREDEDWDISMVDPKQVRSIAGDLGWRAASSRSARPERRW